MGKHREIFLLALEVLFVSNYAVATQVPCYFIFGDSFEVNGNDNNLDTYKANYLPYGIDFLHGPTGRFSDGKTLVDLIAEKIGFKTFIPPFSTIGNNSEIVNGVNYASSGAILQSEIAGSKVTTISLSQQIKNHRRVVRRMVKIFGDRNKTHDHIKKCLYTVGVGGNDYLMEYYTPSNNGSDPTRVKPSEAYAHSLVDQFLYNHLTVLYKIGARKVAVFGLGPLGSSPASLVTFGANKASITVIEEDMRLFNTKIPAIIDRLNKNFKNAQFTFIDNYKLITSTVLPGFKNIRSPCCEIDYDGMCFPNKIPCTNATEHFYWDGHRPTEKANIVLADLAYNASVPSQAYPFNIAQLVSNPTKI